MESSRDGLNILPKIMAAAMPAWKRVCQQACDMRQPTTPGTGLTIPKKGANLGESSESAMVRCLQFKTDSGCR